MGFVLIDEGKGIRRSQETCENSDVDIVELTVISTEGEKKLIWYLQESFLIQEN